MNPDVLLLLDRAVGDLAGLRSTAATSTRLVSSLEGRARARGVRVEQYPDLLREDPRELQAFLELLTVQETSFFRDAAHFTALAEKVLPTLPAGPLTIWSAGCSTGQEAYSLAILLEEQRVRDWRIVASDVSRVALERVEAGWYRDRELRGLSAARRNRWFRRSDGGWVAAPELRERIRTVRHNLALEAPPLPSGDCRVVFCRNVLIYIRREHIAAFVGRMAEWLPPGGHLFLGASEVLWDVDPRFDLVRLAEGAFAYRRTDAPVRTASPPPPEPPAAVPAGRARRRATPSAAPAERTTRTARPARRTVPEGAGADAAAAGTAEELRRAGELAAGAGRHDDAVAAFRKALYLDPDDPVTHLLLGLSLEATGDVAAGRRAYRAAQSALARADGATLERRLEGYGVAAISELLAAKLGGGR